jgi:hypothetical protein
MAVRLSAKKGKGYGGSSADSRSVSEEDWQKCQMILEARKAEERSPPMQERIADLSDVLQKLNTQQPPNKTELRKMAKVLGVPQKKDGLNIDNQTLLQSIQQAFLQEVESLRETGSNLESPAASSSSGDSLVVRQILQDILELGWLPKELKQPKTESDVAEHRLAQRMRGHDLRARAERELRTRFSKRHLKAF